MYSISQTIRQKDIGEILQWNQSYARNIGVKIRIAYNTQQVGKYYSLKASTNCMNQSWLVYKFTCPGDLNNQYVGEIESQLFVRIIEHLTPTNSAVFKHIKSCAFCANSNIHSCF